MSEIGIKINGRVINYADDTVLIATLSERLQKLLNKVYNVSCEFCLEIGARMTRVMVTSKESIEVRIYCSGEH